ncbi:MAG: PKD domain-containing protein [Agriterribacter sp.]
MKQPIKNSIIFIIVIINILFTITCKKADKQIANNKPQADFTFTIKNQGTLPDTVNFSSTSTNANALKWDFDNGSTATVSEPQAVYYHTGKYKVRLIASNQHGVDSIIKEVAITQNKPTPDFSFTIHNQGYLPDTVEFVSTSANATSLKWYFGDGKTDTAANARHIFTDHGTFTVKLVATNSAGSDSVSKPVVLNLNKPIVDFSFTISDPEILPVVVTTKNASSGSKVTYTWSFGNATSTQANPTNNFPSGGIYNIKLVATNASGSDSATKELRISPYSQTYKTFNNDQIILNAWESKNVMILSRNSNLIRATMFKWLKAMDTTYGYYKLCTGREPILFTPYYYINNRTTIADVANTCGAGCGYLGWTGIELQNAYFDVMYNAINSKNQYDQAVFYEFGRNFWFYGDKLAYKTDDPITTGYAVFMRFMAMEAAGVNGAPLVLGLFRHLELMLKI